MIKTIALSFGYAEENSSSWLIFSAEKFFYTRQQALFSLVDYLYSKFKIENETFRANDWLVFLGDLANSTIDSYGGHEFVENPDGWSPWAYDFSNLQHQMLIVKENAEWVLSLALAENYPELKSEESQDEHYNIFSPIEDTERAWFYDDYQTLLDGEVSSERQASETVITDFPNGAVQIMIDGVIDRITYNTGDTVWFKLVNGWLQVKSGITHDGVEFVGDLTT